MMAFVNEYISDENIDKFQIDELMNNVQSKNSKREKKPFPSQNYKHHWTVDKEREIWFMWTDTPNDPLEPSRFTGERFFVLDYKGESIEVVLKKIFKESSRKLTDNPFNIVWTLDRISPESIEELSYEEIIELVKEALGVYGTSGIKTPVPFENIVVTCKF
jgi:hypothetical protein